MIQTTVFASGIIHNNTVASNALDPFNSYKWNDETYQKFTEDFNTWADGMEQSYYKLEDNSDDRFRNKSFEDILSNAIYKDNDIGFTYQNKDYRSYGDSFVVDIFAVYASDIPLEKHLYIFGINQDLQSVVLYLDGDNIQNGNLNFTMTQNEYLPNLFLYTVINDSNKYPLRKWQPSPTVTWYPEGAILAPESETGRWEYYRDSGVILYPKDTYLHNGMAYYSNKVAAPIGTHPETGHDYFADNIEYDYYVPVPSEEIVYYDESEDEYYLDVPDEDGYTPKYHITKKVDPALYTKNQNKPYQADWSFKISDGMYNRTRKKMFLEYGY